MIGSWFVVFFLFDDGLIHGLVDRFFISKRLLFFTTFVGGV